MDTDDSESLVTITARLDQMLSQTDEILASPGDEDLITMGEDLRDWISRMQAKVDEKLEQYGG